MIADESFLDCPSLGKVKGGTVNISDAFESYGNALLRSVSTKS